MRPQQISALALVCGTVTLAGWGPVRLGDATFEDRWAIRGAKALSAQAMQVEARLAVFATPGTSYLRLPELPVVPAALAAGDAAATVAAKPDALPAADVAAAAPASPEPSIPSEKAFAADVAQAEPAASEGAVASAVPSADPANIDLAPAETTFVLASVSPTEMLASEAPLADSDQTPASATRPRLVSLFRPEPADEELKPVVRRVEILHECLVLEVCIDEYLWALYERTPKVDTNKIIQRVKTTVKRKGKTRTVMKSVAKYVTGDFTWKDPIAAQRVGMSLKDYVIGGMDRGFKLKLFRALRAMEDAGHMPGITSAFRDDYRQGIAVGKKAASDSSFHGGSRRGGYGHGLAIDLVSVNGATRMQRFAQSVELWKWVDAHEKELGVGRPYLNRDPPHIAPIDGREFVAKRGGAKVQRAALQTKKGHATKRQTKTAHAMKPQTKTAPAPKAEAKKSNNPRAVEAKKRPVAQRNQPDATTPAKPPKSKVSSLQSRASVQR
jgi:hypothetical protein